MASLIRVRREHDLEWLREVHRVAFPHDAWPTEDIQLYWTAVRGDELLGFAGATFCDRVLHLTRCAVVASAQGLGLQRKLIGVRERYARRIWCTTIETYTTRDNWASITNLIRCGYRFAPCRSPLYFNFTKSLVTKSLAK